MKSCPPYRSEISFRLSYCLAVSLLHVNLPMCIDVALLVVHVNLPMCVDAALLIVHVNLPMCVDAAFLIIVWKPTHMLRCHSPDCCMETYPHA